MKYTRQHLSFIWHLLFALVVIAILVCFWKMNSKRLDLYDKWYMCMYEDWNYDRCDIEIYGEVRER